MSSAGHRDQRDEGGDRPERHDAADGDGQRTLRAHAQRDEAAEHEAGGDRREREAPAGAAEDRSA